jgi:ribosomal protein S18 acetylase RimI-like enzyme
MTSPQQLEVLDLRHFNARQLRPLLAQEADVWEKRLRWEYRSATELLLQYLESRILPGFVALDRGRICGFSFCVYEGHKAVIGDIYSALTEQAPLSITHILARHLIELLEASPDVHRIEAQLLLFDEGVLPPVFASVLSRGVEMQVYPRLFLELEIPRSLTAGIRPLPPELELCRWSAAFYQPTAELIQAAYTGHLDSSINDQYRTLAGSERFLHNIIRFPGCGVFDPQSSFVLRERRSNSPVGVILCSRVASDTAHITQLCLAPGSRGHRLGDTLLRIAMRHLAAHGYRFITLTVSEGNVPAVHLYQAAGFRTRQRFDAMVFEKPGRTGRLLPFLAPR